MELQALAEAIEALVACDPRRFSDAESILELQRQLNRLEAFAAEASACFETSGDWAADGAKSAAAWLATRTRLPKRTVRRHLRLGATARQLPATEAAWLSGEIGVAHVAAISSFHHGPLAEVLEHDEELLVDNARRMRFSAFEQALRYWAQCADLRTAEADFESLKERREVYPSSSFEGLWLGRITLDPIGGSIVGRELRRLEDELFEADWAEAKNRLGREPTMADLRRSRAQRRADALVEMASRSASSPAGARRPQPLFSVFVGYEVLCELADGTVIPPGSLVPWLDTAEFERVVFSPPNRVEVSERARLFTGSTRRAIELRDRTCAHPYCDVPAELCQVDHIVPFSEGGLTTQENGRLLCGFHNRLRNQRPPPDP
ncbi:MAG TPA: DUF222 domain-containing protein [Acidimicrobiales bacterium]|nr:DUF222 domain-containing protein [Acidimicrobiales bacterium]